MRSSIILACVAILSFTSCSENNTVNTESNKAQAILEMKRATDFHSFSRPEEAVVTHLDWDAKVDFETSK